MTVPLFNVWKEFRFNAAHQRVAGPCGDPRYRRGRSYRGESLAPRPPHRVSLDGRHGGLERRLLAVHGDLDHRFLNEVEDLGLPTMDNVATFMRGKLVALPKLHRVLVKRQQNGEGCEYYGPQALEAVV